MTDPSHADVDNRVVVVNNGALSNGQIVVAASTYTTPSYANQYDAAGNVAVRSTLASSGDQFLTYGGNWYAHTVGAPLTQRLVYDARSELVETDYAVAAGEVNRGAQSRETYDADGHLLSNNTYERNGQTWAVYGTAEFPNGYEYLDLSGWLWTGQVSAYGADGQMAQQAQFGRWGVAWKAVANKDDAGTLPDEINATPTVNSDGVLAAGAVTTYTGFDHADNVTDYSYYQPTVVQGTTAFGATYHINYLKKDGYLEQSTTGTPTVSGYVPATDTSYYDAFGRRLAISQTSQANSGAAQNTTRVFADDAAGEIVQRRSGTVSGSTFTPYSSPNSHHYTYVNGQQVSDMDEGGGINVASTLTAFSSGGGSAGSYVVQGGDTLESIAQAVYGNSQYSYIVAEANGLSGDGDLVAGQSITIPSVTTNSNTANTFKPYNPNSITGSTTPSLPAAPPPPPSQAGCSVLGEIVMIAVTVVVAYYTGLYLSQYGSVIAGAGAAAAGDAAGQVAGDAVGVHQGFSFGEVAVAAAGGAIGGAVAGKLSGVDGFSSATATNGLNGWGDAAVGASAYVGNYEAAKVTGQATHFSWAGLVAAGASAAAAGALGATKSDVTRGQLGADPWGNIEARAVGDIVNREVSVGLGDNHVPSWQQIGEDVFGNALGNAAVAGINAYKASHAQQTATPTYDPNKDPLLKYAQGYQNEMAFEQQAQGLVESSPMLAYVPSGASHNLITGPFTLSTDGSDLSLSADGAAGSGGADAGSASATTPPSGLVINFSDNTHGSPNGAQSETMSAGIAYYGADGRPVFNFSWTGQTSSPAGGDGPVQVDQPSSVDAKALAPVTVTASPAEIAAANQPLSLPPIEVPTYQFSAGYFEQAQNIAVQGYNDPNNSLFQRGVFAVLGGLEEPLNLAEGAVRGMMNVPADASIAAQNFAAASITKNANDRVNYFSQGLGATGRGLLNLSGAGGLLESAVARSIFDVSLGTVPNATAVDAGITWGRGIQGQGMPWEDYLAGQLPGSSRLPPNFKTFDFYDLDSGNAISAKTLDTTTASRVADPSRIYYSLRGNVDSVLNFDTPYTLSGTTLDPALITSRELRVAIPVETTPAQWQQINRAIQYGQDNGVNVIVTPAH